MMVFIIIVILIILITIFLLSKSKPIVFKNKTSEELKKYLEILLYRGYNLAFIVITSLVSKDFVQFRKFIDDKKGTYLELGFPKAPWSLKYYDTLKDVLKKNDIEFTILPVDEKDKKSLEFVQVNCGVDVDFCISLTELIFTKVFKQDLLFKFFLENVSPHDEKIGFDDLPVQKTPGTKPEE